MTRTVSTETPPPAGADWVGEWDEQSGDRMFRYPAAEVGNVEVYISGMQARDGFTHCGITVSLRFGVPGACSMAENEISVADAVELMKRLMLAVETARGLEDRPAG